MQFPVLVLRLLLLIFISFPFLLRKADVDNGVITRVAIASDGTVGNLNSSAPSISSDGRYIAFVSSANNLVSGDDNGVADIFVHDRETRQTALVSIASESAFSNGASSEPSISFDGRYIAFVSLGTNLVNGDTNTVADVFVYDRGTGETSLVSVASNGTPSNGNSSAPSISSDGRYVAFASESTSFFDQDNNRGSDVFVHDRQTKKTTLISITPLGYTGYSPSSLPSISADGRYIAFQSLANNLNDEDADPLNPLSRAFDVYVHDIVTGKITLASIGLDGKQSKYAGWKPSISANGRYIAFATTVDSAVIGGTTSAIFVYDQITRQSTYVSVASDGREAANFIADRPSISSDGRYVAFSLPGKNLDVLVEDNRGSFDVFVHDQRTYETRMVSLSLNGAPGYGNSRYPSISGDGHYIAFQSDADDLVEEKTSLDVLTDVYLQYQQRGDVNLATISGRLIDTIGTPVADAPITASFGQTTRTDASGYYTFTDVVSGTHILTPALVGFTISPITRTVTTPQDAPEQNFVQCGSEQLANQYKPIMYFHNAEHYRPVEVSVPLSHSQLVTYSTSFAGLPLKNIIVDSPVQVGDLLMARYNTVNTYLDFEGDTNSQLPDFFDYTNLEAYEAFMPQPQELAYARFYCPTKPHAEYSEIKTVIQYWFFYYDNPWSVHRHEGDWEMIQVLLGDQNEKQNQPLYVGYSQHYDGIKRPWKDIEKEGENPVVYVSKDGHASHFVSADSNYKIKGVEVLDTTKPSTRYGTIRIQIIPQRQDRNSWLYYNGHWGRKEDFGDLFDGDGPLGPRGRIAEDLDGDPSLWNDPMEWFVKLSPYSIADINTKGNKINLSVHKSLGISLDTGNSIQRMNTEKTIEYFEDPKTQQRTLIIHDATYQNSYTMKIYTEYADLLPVGSSDLVIYYPTSEAINKAVYSLPTTWSMQSQALFNISRNGITKLQVDLDGNNIYEQILQHTSMISEPFDFGSEPDSKNVFLPLIMQ